MFEKYLKRVDPKDIGLQQAGKFFLEFIALNSIDEENNIEFVDLISTVY